ncbi:MAG TPA: class I SAM-dependent methyltransferase [Caulobacteraceae bacterium]|nr:class I SAM-dependent methyltransferase [Caulobacteraceae bacterium]
MSEAAEPNAAQVAYWNENAGPTWVAMQDALDEQLEGLGQGVIAVLDPKPGERIIDVGCGCGATTLELARRVGPGGHVLGADISAPMLAVAKARAKAVGLTQADFAEVDAQTHAFEPADGVLSRFGVMFFSDPVAAFANLRRALTPGGRVAFVCWRAMADNPLMTVPLAAILPLLPEPPAAPPPGAPGPFAFADRDRLFGILKDAGFADIRIDAHDEPMGYRRLETAVQTALSMGPVGMASRTNPDLRPRFEVAVREVLAARAAPDGSLRMPSATWFVRAS